MSADQDEDWVDCTDNCTCCESCDKLYMEKCPQLIPNLEAYTIAVEESGSQFVKANAWPVIRGCFCVLTVIFFFYDIGVYIRDDRFGYWFIYLTHWAFTLTTVYLCLVFSETVILYRAFVMHQRIVTVKELGYTNLARTSRAFMNLALGPTVALALVYWSFLYEGNLTTEELILTMYKHGVTAVLLLIDAFLSASWLRHKDVIFPAILAVSYGTWTIIHWAAKIGDGLGNNYIYKIINWDTPGSAAAFTIGTIGLLMVFHWSLVFSVNALRNYETERVNANLPIVEGFTKVGNDPDALL